ncbi:HAMP domain-containing sensor histidine kinase [Streptomyces lanatus]|uniref:histidine kinase n=1 Tax=Streptomyces lanatus TaxID=66900 RepID=A0ABV1XY03_9ACTN|nr:HAMP domain-containing sensor histidine kinase [Streptomyces lanatus]GHG90288.1 sensor histidine kinase [Streptomyces lanatus]
MTATAAFRNGRLHTRLLLLIGLTLVAVCTALAFTAVFVQRAYLLGDLDDRVETAAARLHPGPTNDLSFLTDGGHPDGMLAARLDDGGGILAAGVVRQDASPRALTDAQRTALADVGTDGATHTASVPGLGTYRITVAENAGVRVLAGLPTADVQHMIRGMLAVEAAVAAAGLAVAGGICAVVVRRQLRPLARVAATAAEVSRAPDVTGLTRVRIGDTDPASEAGQVGAALNRMIDHVESATLARRHSEERMRRFLADASHELRTPLASIAGYAELMNHGPGRIEPVLAWRRVSAESARMTGLVEDLLLLARLDEGRPLHSTEVDVAALVAEAVWDARTAGSGHDWQLELGLDDTPLALGDEAGLRQVVANLLANARMHTPAGTRVVAAVECAHDRCVVRVRDDGPGIPPALLPTVFDRFTRADTSRTRSAPHDGGSGLGLAIVAAIVAAHGGHIEVESEPGRTEFTVRLPRAVPLPGGRSADAAVGQRVCGH